MRVLVFLEQRAIDEDLANFRLFKRREAKIAHQIFEFCRLMVRCGTFEEMVICTDKEFVAVKPQFPVYLAQARA